MTHDNTTRQQTLLDQYWDAAETNRQYIPDELDASLLETVDQFHAADDAPAPDREFIDRLWADLSGDTPAASTTAPGWTEDPTDEPGEPQFVPQREGNPMQAKQQSNWRRRGRQILEMVAGILVLALATGGLILAYQHLGGSGDNQSTGIPGSLVERRDLLLFTGEHNGSRSIFVASADGAIVEPITDDTKNDGRAVWSPDGSQIAFFRSPPPEDMASTGAATLMVNPHPSPELHVMNADGSDLRQLTDEIEVTGPPFWSPDGSVITFPVHRDTGGMELQSIDLSTGESQTILSTDWQDQNLDSIRGVTWSPDGSRLSFIGAETDQTGRIFVVNRDGSSLTAITERDETGMHGPAEWSPDGKRLTFTIGSPRPNVVVVDADGSNRRNLTNHDRTDVEPAWSPDGQEIVFASQFSSAGDRGIYVVDTDGTRVNPLVETEGSDQSPIWSPDGEKIAFFSVHSEGGFHSEQDWLIQISDADGNQLRTIIEQRVHPDELSWRPDPTLHQGESEQSREPTPEPDEPSSDTPEQDPREVVMDVVSALGDDDWDRVRELTIPELREFNDSAIRSTVAGDLPNLVAVGTLPLDSVDDWTVEHYEGWAVVRHREQPPLALVLVEHDGEWQIDPGFHQVSRARIISELGPEGLREHSPPIALAEWDGDADPMQISSSIEGNVAATRVSESSLDVAVRLRFHPADEATLSVEDIRWSADGADGQAEIVRTNASLTGDHVDFPLTRESGGIYWMILRASNIPEDARNLVFTLEEIQISGLQRADVDVNDMVVTGTFDVPNQTWPDLPESISNDASSANAPVHFPRQSPGDHEYDDGGPVGTLALDDQGCLRVGDENGPVIIWPYEGFSVDMVDGEVALINDETRNVVAHVGDTVSFHGSDPEYPLDSVPDHMLNEPLPEACAGADGYFITGPGIGAQ